MNGPPSSFVPADTNLFEPSAHSGRWLVLGVIAAVLGLVLLIWCLRPVKARVARPARISVKERYLAEIDDLRRQYADGVIDARELHHRLSWTVRRFAADHGAPGALAMTPTVLDEVGQPVVAGIVARYQPPQFMERAECEPERSVASAKDVIRSW